MPHQSAERFPASQYVRRARRTADLSQRELAARSGVSARTIGRIESGRVSPSIPVLTKLLAVGGYELIMVVAGKQQAVPPMRDLPLGERDCQGRRYPAHLDVIVDPREGEWWGDYVGLATPPETFHRNRHRRDEQRRRYLRGQRLYGRARTVLMPGLPPVRPWELNRGP